MLFVNSSSNYEDWFLSLLLCKTIINLSTVVICNLSINITTQYLIKSIIITAGELWISDTHRGDHLLLHCQTLHPAEQVRYQMKIMLSLVQGNPGIFRATAIMTKSLSSARSTSSSTALPAKGSGRASEAFSLPSSHQKDPETQVQLQTYPWVRVALSIKLNDM